MKQVWMTKVGPPEVLKIKEASDPTVQKGQIRIRVKASGINFADIMARLGFYPDAPKLPAVIGYEVSGIVDKISDSVTQFKVGDSVVALCRFGGYSDVVVVPWTQAFSLPKGITFSQAAAIPVNYLTVYQMLNVMGGLKRNERVLIHSAAGGIGLAAIDLCKIAGAEILGTASLSKHAFLKARGVEHCIDRTKDFETEVMRVTNGKGVHIILDPIGGKSWSKGFRSLAPTGRLIVFGFSAAASGKKRHLVRAMKNFLEIPWLKMNPLTLMNENKAVIGANLGHMWNERESLAEWMRQILQWYEEGKIHPTVAKEFKLDEAALSHHYIQDRQNIGKVILTP